MAAHRMIDNGLADWAVHRWRHRIGGHAVMDLTMAVVAMPPGDMSTAFIPMVTLPVATMPVDAGDDHAGGGHAGMTTPVAAMPVARRGDRPVAPTYAMTIMMDL